MDTVLDGPPSGDGDESSKPHVSCTKATIHHQRHEPHDWTIDGEHYAHCPGHPAQMQDLPARPCLQATLMPTQHAPHVWGIGGTPRFTCNGYLYGKEGGE